MGDLSDFFTEHRFSLINLDLSQNLFTVDSLFKIMNALKVGGQTQLKRLNLSRNNFGFED